MKKSLLLIIPILMLAFLAGACIERVELAAYPIRADINNDGSIELVYLEIDRSRTGNDYYYDWDLKVVEGYGTDNLTEPVTVLSFETKPEDLRVEDYNSDGVNDVVFLIIDRSATGQDNYYDWHMMVALGVGDGSFSSPQIIMTFERRPGTP